MSDINELKFEEMWYASTKKAKSRSKKVVYDSKHGVLIINKEKGTFSYIGNDVTIENQRIKAIATKRQSFHYWTYLSIAVPIIILFALKQDLLYGVFGILIGAILGGFIWFSMKWIVIEYELEDGKIDWAWFFDGHYMGWAGPKGTKKKFKKIKHFLGIS